MPSFHTLFHHSNTCRPLPSPSFSCTCTYAPSLHIFPSFHFTPSSFLSHLTSSPPTSPLFLQLPPTSLPPHPTSPPLPSTSSLPPHPTSLPFFNFTHLPPLSCTFPLFLQLPPTSLPPTLPPSSTNSTLHALCRSLYSSMVRLLFRVFSGWSTTTPACMMIL